MSQYDNLVVTIRLSIIDNDDHDEATHEGTLGKGVVTLLQGIVDYGSLNQAAKRIGMAYSKAWRIVKETEKGFGFLLINRDGARGSTLTKEGEQLLEIYHSLAEETREFANERFKQKIAEL